MTGNVNLSLPPASFSATEAERDMGKLKRAAEGLGNVGLQGTGLSREEQEKRLKKACDQFEAMLVKMVLKSMRDATPKDGLFSSGLDQDIYTSMMDDSLAESIAAGRSLGISRAMFEQMKSRMDAAPAEAGRRNEGTGNVAEAPLAAPLSKAQSSRLSEEAGLKTVPSSHMSPKPHTSHAGAQEVQFAPPLEGKLSSDFGWRKDPFTAEKRFHKGIDLAAPRGTPVLSSAEGKVVFSGWQRGHGNTVVIKHPDGYETRYSHNAQNLVQAGDHVGRGHMIARVGDTGRSTGPHLHFEVKKGGVSVDPTELMA